MENINDNEIWQKIQFLEDEGYGTHYVSNKGKVKNKKNLLRKFQIDKYGYYRLSFRNKERKTKQLFAHRLVAIMFIDNPQNKTQINHKDLNKKNNCVENLEWCNNSENIKHLYLNKVLTQKGSKNNSSILKEEQVVEIYKLKGKMTHKKIGEIYGVARSTISQIMTKTNWKHLTDTINID
jgi:hypothetical protein